MNSASSITKNEEREGWTRALRGPLLPLFLLALAVRFLGSGWGLPNAERWYSYHPDESTRQTVGAVVSMLQGDSNPHFFNYPSLSIYATWLIYQLLAGFALTTNVVSPEYPWPVVRDIIFAGRLFSILCGALTAPLIFLIARHLQSGRWAILAGVLAALAPGHVQHSHFATADVPATFFVIWCIYLSLRAQKMKALLWAGVVAGLAAGTKYNAGLVLVAPLIALYFLPNRSAKRVVFGTFALIAVALASFFVTTPFALLAPSEFWGDGMRGGESGFAYELLVHPKIGSGEIFQGTGNGWIYHFTFNLPFLLTWPIIFGALIGAALSAKKREFWAMLVFALLFFLSLGLSQVRFMRYLLPIAPVLCLLAAYGVSHLPKPKVWSGVLSIFTAIGCFNALWPFLQIDPRDQAATVLRGQRVSVVGNPWFYTPPFQPRGFNTPVPGVIVTDGAIGPSPFAISEFEWREAQRLGKSPNEIVSRIENQSLLVQSFKTRVPLALPGRAFVPHDYLYTNPEIRIY